MRKLSSIVLLLCCVLLPQAPARAAGGGAVVISEVYPGGGNTDATYANDYVELFNRTASAVSFTGWSIGYSSRTSTTWRSVPLTGSISPYRYFLVKLGTGGGAGRSALPAADVTGSVNVARTGGKVRVFDGKTTVDLLGFGTDVNAYETDPNAAPADNAHSLIRINAGCTDTNNNEKDFKILVPGPRNKASHGFECGGGSGTNSAPVLAPIGPKSTDANKRIAFTVSATDSDRQPLTYSASPLPTGARFTPSTRTFEWTPTTAQVGTHRVTFAVTDGALRDSETVTITVNRPAEPTRTTISLDVTEDVNRVVGTGSVTPAHPGMEVVVRLFRYEQGGWRRDAVARQPLDPRSAFRASFARPRAFRCLMSATFNGGTQYPSATTREEFRC